MPAEEVDEKSSAIYFKILSLDAFEKAGRIMIYMDIRNEVQTGRILAECLKRGKKAILPVVAANGNLLPYQIIDPERDLKKGAYGIHEPDTDAAYKVSEDEIDLIIVPGVVFDICGYRIGYGAGYYDRFLKKVRPDCVKIGLAFDMQIIDSIPIGCHDVPVDTVISEKRIINKIL